MTRQVIDHCAIALSDAFEHQYIYNVVKDQCTLPEEALAMIRYHSFYPYATYKQISFIPLSDHHHIGRWHREGAYTHLTNAKDAKALVAVRAFNPYDLYSKCDEPVNAEKLRPYYENLIAKFFPPELDW